MAPVLKTGRAQALVGSNPTPSATQQAIACRRQTPESISQSAPRTRSTAALTVSRFLSVTKPANIVRSAAECSRSASTCTEKYSIMLRIGEPVIFSQSRDLGFRDRRDLALVCIKSCDPISRRRSNRHRGTSQSSFASRSICRLSAHLPSSRRAPRRIATTTPDDSACLLLRRSSSKADVSSSLDPRSAHAPLRDRSETPRRDDRYLSRVIGERILAQLASCPGKIKRMGQEMFRGDLAVDSVEMLVHCVSSMIRS